MLTWLRKIGQHMPWWRLWRIRRRINRSTAALLRRLRKTDKSLTEYGHLRRGKPWGAREGDELVWFFLVDLLSDRPLVYKIVYRIPERRFICYSRSGGKNELANVLQFSTDDIDALVSRLYALAEEIPAMRERMLRQYLYTLRQEKAPRRWLPFLRRRDPGEEQQTLATLRDVIQAMLLQKKISNNEALKLMAYAETLSSE
ncbi:MAG: hypothetical protein N2Z22_03470 [Turneriella sp.]|nr:hypothetical protein [Turneriella sp.]